MHRAASSLRSLPHASILSGYKTVWEPGCLYLCVCRCFLLVTVRAAAELQPRPSDRPSDENCGQCCWRGHKEKLLQKKWTTALVQSVWIKSCKTKNKNAEPTWFTLIVLTVRRTRHFYFPCLKSCFTFPCISQLLWYFFLSAHIYALHHPNICWCQRKNCCRPHTSLFLFPTKSIFAALNTCAQRFMKGNDRGGGVLVICVHGHFKCCESSGILSQPQDFVIITRANEATCVNLSLKRKLRRVRLPQKCQNKELIHLERNRKTNKKKTTLIREKPASES